MRALHVRLRSRKKVPCAACHSTALLLHPCRRAATPPVAPCGAAEYCNYCGAAGRFSCLASGPPCTVTQRVAGHPLATTIERCASYNERSADLAPGTGCPASLKMNTNRDSYVFRAASSSPPPEVEPEPKCSECGGRGVLPLPRRHPRPSYLHPPTCSIPPWPCVQLALSRRSPCCHRRRTTARTRARWRGWRPSARACPAPPCAPGWCGTTTPSTPLAQCCMVRPACTRAGAAAVPQGAPVPARLPPCAPTCLLPPCARAAPLQASGSGTAAQTRISDVMSGTPRSSGPPAGPPSPSPTSPAPAPCPTSP